MGEKYSSARQHSHIHGRRDLLSLVSCDTARAIAKILLIHYAHHALARYHEEWSTTATGVTFSSANAWGVAATRRTAPQS